MPQHDMDVGNGPGLTFRNDLNAALQALVSLCSGASTPNPTFPCQLWADTGTGRLKQRNSANTAWLDMGALNSALREAVDSTSSAIDTGVANAYVCAFTPAIAARSEQQVLRFKAKTANTGACTLNDGFGVVALVGGAHSALQGGEIAANGDCWVQWNTSVGGGSYILLFCTGAAGQVAPGSKSQHTVNVAQIQAQGLTAFTSAGVSPSLTLAPAPALTAYAANQRFRVKFSQASTAADTMNISNLGAKSLKQYDSAGGKVAAVFAANQLSDVEYDGTDMVVLDPLPSTAQATETVLGGAKVATQPQVNAGIDDSTSVTPKKLVNGISSSLATNGFIKLPTWMGGVILQWGTNSLSSAQLLAITLPITFPNSSLVGLVSGSLNGVTTAEQASQNVVSITTTQITIKNTGNGSPSVRWFAVGY